MKETHSCRLRLLITDRNSRPSSSKSEEEQVLSKTRTPKRSWSNQLDYYSKQKKNKPCARPTLRRSWYTNKSLDKDDLQLWNLVRALIQARIHVYNTVLLPRYDAFVQCIKKNRTEVVGSEAIKLYKELAEKKHYDDESVRKVWFDEKKHGRYYKIFHSYLKRWDVDSSLEFVTKLHLALIAHQNGNTKSFQKQLRNISENHLRHGTIPIHQMQRATLETLVAQRCNKY